ncbi:hypothetical protein [Thermoanaerobacter mathranii]|uniref:hypothetical protein n=1 Tax=Thermoanaerobacter mathranii TaxID=583357 RepID=UPI003D6A107F
MIKLIIPSRVKNKTYNKDFAYLLWEKLGVTGNMQIIPHEDTIEIRLDAEQNLTPSMVKRKLPPLLAEASIIEETI